MQNKFIQTHFFLNEVHYPSYFDNIQSDDIVSWNYPFI